MTESVARELVAASEEYYPDGCEPLDFRKDYCGRGMGERSTAGVVGDHRTFFAAIGRAVQQSDDPDEIIEAVGRVRMDSMGKYDTIFY